VEEPTSANAQAAELAIALLQRRYDDALRRLDGSAGPPDVPVLDADGGTVSEQPRRLDADLNQEDDDGNGWTLVGHRDFGPSWLFPGALVDVGRKGGHTLATVLRTELFETTDGRTVVLVTFRKNLLPGDRERYQYWRDAHGSS
jgi:hypothetical protein